MTNQTTNIKSQKTPKKFTCIVCDYTSYKRSDYDKHLSTRKHVIRTSDNFSSQNSQQKKYDCVCGKIFKHASSLWNHKKKCTYSNENTVVAISNNHISTSIVDKKEDMSDMKELIIALMTQNQEMHKEMLNILPQIGNTTNNNTMSNSNNKTNNFNVNMFLNEHCQNAMNISDFIESLPITYQDLDNTRKHGLSESISNMLIKGLDDMSIYERPIHCTDPSRKTVYVRDNDEWVKDENNEIIQKSSVRLAIKQRNNVKVWKDEYMVGKVSDTTQINYHDMVINCLKFIEHDEKIRNKIVKKVCREEGMSSDSFDGGCEAETDGSSLSKKS
jgi:hypothetical protein